MIKYIELTTDERTHDLYERREKARRDQAMFLKDSMLRVAKNLLDFGDPIEKIITVTGLTREVIENLNHD